MASRTVTGLHAIEESLRRGATGGRLLVAGGGERIRRLGGLARGNGVSVENVAAAELRRVGGEKARGAVLLLPEKAGARRSSDLGQALDRIEGDTGLVLVLDGITDPHNLGAIIRSADQFAADLVVLPERRSAQLGDTVSRTSAGADRWVDVAVVANVARAIAMLKERRFWVYGADASGRPVHELALAGRTALVLGREGEGLHRLVRESCDDLVAIPTGGHIDSLNVSVSAGVLLYEARRQAGFAGLG